ncbi:MAG: beta-ketoacyl-ACP synthase II [Acidimicrobiales bacterium]|jgi:3-oxoacyl-[acyl-carrier-protein] synthase II|nr:beta-ketoacyl-ACP synthase II [Acidimicrobiales bacterium]HJM27872.1 beta-ketoacyl-ACP synthase II [Acidimicrobiales bacterium]HJM98431.1 beta-ketoacyl-ACP synthase II [Acidimicrobiales bacterium]
MNSRVAITGIGVVSNAGVGTEAFWDSLMTGVPEHGFFVKDFDPLPYFDDNAKQARRSDRFAQFALAAAHEAITQAGDFLDDPTSAGSWVGTGVGGISTLENQTGVLADKGPRRVSPFLVPMMMANAASASISMKYNLQGPCETTVTACAAGTHSIGRAADLIRCGKSKVMIAGGTEAALTPIGTQGFINMTAVSSSGISRPFDKERDGFLQSEGAGILVLEEWNHAESRGALILAELMGLGSTADAHHITAPAPGGNGAVRCMNAAISDAGLSPVDIVHINAHGTSTPLNDAAEAEAIERVFGNLRPLVTGTKSVTGHSLGAAGALEAVAVVLSILNGTIPPTHGTTQIDPELKNINLVIGEPQSWIPGPAISNSFGFGGHNGTIVIGPATGA